MVCQLTVNDQCQLSTLHIEHHRTQILPEDSKDGEISQIHTD